MRLILSLSVLAVALLMVLEGPAPAQADSSIPEDLKAFGDTVKEKVLAAVDKVKEIDLSKAWPWITDKFSQVKDTIKKTFS
ncbi:apolipoprotein C-I-like [Eptesicus fuscus]|uniref:apolipoprotein C-I-like n=1 Tax=Eptesicus fuscus TaxID=29078 RepID=UPI0024041D1B|nr:apolipoprotein C-I-like [Eptesicus fuscus]